MKSVIEVMKVVGLALGALLMILGAFVAGISIYIGAICLLALIPTVVYWTLLTKLELGAYLTFLPVNWQMPGFVQTWALCIFLFFVVRIFGRAMGHKPKTNALDKGFKKVVSAAEARFGKA